MGRMTYVKALMCLLFPSAALVARAQHPVAGDLKCKLTGRMLMDGGVYLKNDNQFGNGTEFNDLRLGVKATYQNWSMKMEVGYVGNKVSIKDAFAAYTSGKHIIQVGQFYEPFTLDMLCSTYDLRFHQSPGIVLALTNGRRMYNPQIQISAESETKRSIFREKDKTKRSKKESAQHSKSRNKSFVMTSVSAL